MADKSKQIIGDNIGFPYSRKWIEENYSFKKLTDDQWEVLADYLASANGEEEWNDFFLYGFYNIEELVEKYKSYDEVWLEIHGNPYPFDKDGNNTQEDN
jgi:hypothetical protein